MLVRSFIHHTIHHLARTEPGPRLSLWVHRRTLACCEPLSLDGRSGRCPATSAVAASRVTAVDVWVGEMTPFSRTIAWMLPAKTPYVPCLLYPSGEIAFSAGAF